MRPIKILCIGEEWRGSNASGLFYAFSRIGCITNVVNELKYVSVYGEAVSAKVVNRLIRPFQISDFNNELKSITNAFLPDIVFVYKGAYIFPDTVSFWKKRNLPVVNFFPDVSFLAHGKYIPACIPLYDHLFTTKTFAANDLYSNFGYDKQKVSFIPHGFDPLIHRKLALTKSDLNCDVSFIGNYSIHKNNYLTHLVNCFPTIDLRIWGNTWRNKENPKLVKAIQNLSIIGDLYALALNVSLINLGLLSEKVIGASSGDQITSRTFHIPGAGGFLLHQRTQEVSKYFDEGTEMVCFDSPEEMAEMTNYYLNHESERIKIQEAGYRRARGAYSLDVRAEEILTILKSKGIL